VIPIIIEGLSIVAKERPKKPIEYLAAFFIKNRERFGESV
jgi:protein dpy-30